MFPNGIFGVLTVTQKVYPLPADVQELELSFHQINERELSVKKNEATK